MKGNYERQRDQKRASETAKEHSCVLVILFVRLSACGKGEAVRQNDNNVACD